MAVYLMLGILGGLIALWLVGYAVSALIDSRRPQEPTPPSPLSEDDRLQTVQRLTAEWQQVRHHWIKESDSDDSRRAA